ncbi:hypothetical protein CCACVL1_01202 [Corchorus capsularis]|uniref:Reverse transcriptase, RNA-dependent DNA polymerase n=1 Tax=Corchorus capsularis TaxID=210143 RepID=A0A1R3KLB2_COCAP|nr:hypothetical protein CCACVL1_01202 [Corchorus capsularis]
MIRRVAAGHEVKNDGAKEYRSVIGALQHLSITRPGISFAANKLAQFINQPTDVHWQALKRVLRYLKCTLSTGLFLRKSTTSCRTSSTSCSNSSSSLYAYTYTDWAGDTSDCKSTSAYFVYLNGNLISWKCNKQKMLPDPQLKPNTGPLPVLRQNSLGLKI